MLFCPWLYRCLSCQGYSDLGMGMAIVNTLAAESATRPQPLRSQRAISVVWFTLLTIAGLGLVLLSLAWIGIERFASPENIKQYQALLLSASIVLVGLPSGLIQRILFARHRTTEAMHGVPVVGCCLLVLSGL